MELYIQKTYRPICQSCCLAARASRHVPRHLSLRRPVTTAAQWKPSSQSHTSSLNATKTTSNRTDSPSTSKASSSPQTVSTTSLDIGLGEAQKLSDKVLKHPFIPTNDETLSALQAIESATERLIDLQRPHPSNASPQPTSAEQSEDTTAGTSLLSLDAQTRNPNAHLVAKKAPQISDSLLQARSSALSNLAYALLTHPPISITPQLLKTYTNIQSLLNRPCTFPEIFDLYASKPEASLDPRTKQIIYRSPTPRNINRASAAIPLPLAKTALQAAIRARSLTTALSIITVTTSARAFKKRKILTKASPFLAAIPASPIAAWMLAKILSAYQTGLDNDTFISTTSMGVFTYMSVVGILGYVTVTTANDQMRRVTWVPGVPLWQRWVMEDERAMVDDVVCAFGFRDKRRWGEEEGVEWWGVKEFAGVRGLVVDRVELMEGME